jgi:hypothetical protein
MKILMTVAAMALGAVAFVAPSQAADETEPTMSCERLNDGAYWKCRIDFPQTNHGKLKIYMDDEWYMTDEMWFGDW